MSTQDNGKTIDIDPTESLSSAELQPNSEDIPSVDAPLDALKLDATNGSEDTRLESVELHRPEENARDNRPQPIQTSAAEGPIPADANMADYVTPPSPGASPLSDPAYRKALEEDAIRTNTIPTLHVDLKNVKANTLTPKEQEKQGKSHQVQVMNAQVANLTDESMLEGIQALLNNKFSAAQSIFKSHAREYVQAVAINRI
ncbi:hypothetical protein BCR43DRAFT_117696 [Syncephalastrum racemosum]|uniref:Uncharacterized protein n=1 Tax=Syncephalastrum racemosum TaxID=13706 RepID=A0A1X2H0L0_SYNRA|nr:hypothetical protein BCR43DRAFT_117696 [Syncephalastrum racemosum]